MGTCVEAGQSMFVLILIVFSIKRFMVPSCLIFNRVFDSTGGVQSGCGRVVSGGDHSQTDTETVQTGHHLLRRNLCSGRDCCRTE